jgi:KipI family sensor histidine kinase inhibitor
VEPLTVGAFSEKAVLITLQQPDADAAIIALGQWAKQYLPMPPVDVVSAANSLMLVFDRPHALLNALQVPWQQVLTALASQPESNTQSIDIPVCFNLPYPTDLAALAAFAGCTQQEAKLLLLQATFKVRFMGFLPGFPYLEGVPPQLAIPRKASPQRVRAGAVAIAGMQAGIYPVASPGGWHVVGYTPLVLFNPHRQQPCLLQPGFAVRFIEVSAAEYEGYQKQEAP